MMNLKSMERALTDIGAEAISGETQYGEYQSYHEGTSVIREEFEEMWDEVKKRERDPHRVYEECIQIAATALRLALQAEDGLQR